jgi:WD40 repeat protein
VTKDARAPTVGETSAGASVNFVPYRTAVADAPEAAIATAWNIDGYEIISKLGQGGMGTVWRAVQLSTRREVALKLLHMGLSPSERARQRFEREIELTASLQHPRIARVYDSGVQKGAYYYAMELIEGVPVDQYAADHGLTRREILKLFCSIAEAVQYAHQRGVIHRDLKPTNIIVDPQGEPHVLDFGVAKLFDLKNSDPPVSIDGEVVGTPAFMSPEQAEGSAALVDMRSDVYSLGAVLYLLLTGKLPHDATGTYIKVLRCVSEQEIIRPTKARADIGSELEAILLKALSRDIESRYESAGMFAADLNNYLLGEPLLARRRTAFYFLRKKLWKHRYIAATALAGLMVLSGFAARDTMRTRAERDFAIASAAKERAANQLAQAANRTAQLHLADALLAWGDSLAAANKWEEAREKYWQAHDIWAAFSLPTTAADAALADSYQHAPLPLIEFRVPAAPHLAAAFTPSGIAVFSGSDGTITSLDPCTGVRQIVSGKINGMIDECHFSEDGRSIVALVNPRDQLGRPEFACMAEIEESRGVSAPRIFPLSGTRGYLLTLSPDGRFAAYNAAPNGKDDGVSSFLADLDRPSAPLSLFIDFPYAFAFSPDSRSLYVGSKEGTICKFQTADGSIGWSTKSVVRISAIQCMGSENRLLVGSESGRLALCDSTGQVVRALAGHSTAVAHLAVSHDGVHALSSDVDGELRLWDTEDGSLEFSVQAHPGPLASLAMSGNGAQALSADRSGSIKLWQIKPNAQVVSSFTAASPTALGLSPDGQLAVCGHGAGLVVLVDVATGKCLYRLKLGHEPVDSICFSSDGLEMFAAQGGIVNRWNLDDPLHSMHFRVGSDDPYGHEGPGQSHTVFSSQGNIAMNVQPRGGAAFWDMRTGHRLQALPLHFTDVVALSADGKAALVRSMHGIQVLDVASGRMIAEGELPDIETLLQIALSPDARTALASTQSGQLYLWHVGEERNLHLLASEAGDIKHIQFSPDSNFAVTSSESTLKFWDITNQRELRTLDQYDNLETLVAIGADSSILYTHIGERDINHIRLIDLHMPAVYRELANRVPSAWRALEASPDDSNALSALGQWYALRDESDWAGKLLDAARARGAEVPLMVLARSDWKTGKSDQAAELFRQILRTETSPVQRVYLTLCLRAADEEAKSHSPLAISVSSTSP